MRDTLLSCRFAAVILALTAPVLVLAQDAEEDADEAEAIVEEPIELAAQTVTGSQLIGGDPSTKVLVLSAEDISRRGVSSLEDLFRTLPWAFPSISTQTNTTIDGSNDTDINLGALGLGTSTVNLRALGSANTLVLVDGRRIAGKAGNDDNFANLLNVPLAAVERVEIQLDGASAVYGSDAIGGVVNFIMKKNYRGLSVTARNEWSATEADRNKIDAAGGFSWGDGNLNVTVSRTKSKPINNYKLWTSNDYRSEFGPEFDQRATNYGQPGKVCDHDGFYDRFAGCDYFEPNYRQLTSGSGVGATPGDFSSEIEPVDVVLPQNGEDSTSTALQFSIEQYVTDSFRIYASALVSDHEAYQQGHSAMRNYIIPASNAYNPFGKTVVVSYYPVRELQDGLIPYSYTESEDKVRTYAAGFYWELSDKHQLNLDISRSESKSVLSQIETNYGRSRYDPSAAKFYGALASPDPNVALNLFGDGTAQGSAFAELFTATIGPRFGFTETTIIKPLVRGELFRIWGGAIRYVAGLETEKTKIYSHEEGWGAEGPVRGFGREGTIGVEEPTTDKTSYYAELAFPIFSPENARAGLNALNLSVQMRRDNHTYEGASGGVGSVFAPHTVTSTVWIPNQGWTEIDSTRYFMNVGEPNFTKETKSATTYRLGLHYQPVENFTVRLTWSQSFQPPTFGDLFDVYNADSFGVPYVDPYHPDGFTGQIYPTTVFSSANLDIKSEFSDNYRVAFDWNPESIPGLALSLDWSMVDFTNKIAHPCGILRDNPKIAFALPNLVERDADGYVTQINAGPLNLAEKQNEILELRAQYDFQTAIGSFTPRLTYTRTLDEYFTVAVGSPRIERVGTAKGSNKYKLVGSVTWVADKFAADLFAYYTPSYENNRTGTCYELVGRCEELYVDKPTLTVGALTTVDLTVTYQFDNGLRLRGGGRNILAADSRTLWQELPYDPTRWDARGRVLFLELQYEM